MTEARQRPVTVADLLAGESAWFVGGVVRDSLLGRDISDVDLVVEGDVEAMARRLGKAIGGAVFPLSEDFGGWRIVPREGGWQVDLTPVAPGGLAEDLARRDFTVNAIACKVQSVSGAGAAALSDPDALIDPHGGRADLSDGVLRHVGPDAFADDPLRVARLARFACGFGLTPSDDTVRLARASAAGLGGVAGERSFSELLGILSSPDAVGGVRLLDRAGGLAALVPEIDEIRDVEQSVYHHLDVWEHTLDALARVDSIQQGPEVLGPAGPAAADLLDGDLADGADRWTALRLCVLFHDIAKGRTRTVHESGKVGFPGHDELGAAMASDILGRLRASSKLNDRIATMIRHHLDLGYMSDSLPLPRRAVHGYLGACGGAALDVTVLTVADRLATRGRKHEEAIARHLEAAAVMVEAAVEREIEGEPAPLVRGDELAGRIGIEPGPLLGSLLGEIAAARYAGEVSTPDEAVELARRVASAGQ